MKWCLAASEDSSVCKFLDTKSEPTKNYVYDILI